MKLYNLATLSLLIEFHFSETSDEWRKILYGTTVVPIRPNIIIRLSELILGLNIPFNRLVISGLVIIAVIKNDKLITITRDISDPSIIL